MATTLQPRETKRSDASKFFCGHILFLFLAFQSFTKRLHKTKNIFIYCAIPKKEAAQYTTGHDKIKAAEG